MMVGRPAGGERCAPCFIIKQINAVMVKKNGIRVGFLRKIS